MDGHIDRSGDAPAADARVGDLASLAADFAAALNAPDVRAARGLVVDALGDGVAPGLLYVSVVRPALVALQGPSLTARARLAAGLGQAILADLVAHLSTLPSSGTSRAAVLSCRQTGIESVDGTVAMDFLESDGWRVERMLGPADSGPGDAVAAMNEDGTIELAVAVISGPQDALRLASACTRLRRLADPPVIILCDFSGSPVRGASQSLGADDVVGDPGALLRSAARRLPLEGRRRWGVGLRRSGQTLVLAPTGTLDITSVGRLADVALSRAGTFSCLVVDLREVAVLEASGIRALAGWPAGLALGTTDFVTVAGDDVPGTGPDADGLGPLRGDARWRVLAHPPV